MFDELSLQVYMYNLTRLELQQCDLIVDVVIIPIQEDTKLLHIPIRGVEEGNRDLVRHQGVVEQSPHTLLIQLVAAVIHIEYLLDLVVEGINLG